MKLTKPQRDILKMKFGGLCAYCGEDLKANWQADHHEPVGREYVWQRSPQTGVYGRRQRDCRSPQNDCLENLFPSCRACNIDKSNYPLEYWRKSLEGRVDVCRRNHSAFRHAERFGLVKQISTKVVFYFEIHDSAVTV